MSLSDRFVRKVDRKGEIVARHDEAHWPVAHSGYTRHKGQRTYRRPVSTQFLQRYVACQTSAHVRRRESVPHNIRHIAGNVIESPSVEIRLVGKRQERNTRSDAR